MSLFTNLFSLFNDGKKCEEKKEVKFKDRVRVTRGFYEGSCGYALDFDYLSKRIYVKLDNSEIVKMIYKENLEVI